MELNGLPRVGEPGSYRNVREWFHAVWRAGESADFKSWLDAPLSRRLGFSAFLNLLNGCVTVAHHNRYYWRYFPLRFPVDVPRIAWFHSLAIEQDPRRFASRRPYVLHFAEGVDAEAEGELARLKALGLLAPGAVLVHAVGVRADRMSAVRDAGAGIVWCPGSNLFLFGKTLAIGDALAYGVPVALGSDSTLSSEGGLLNELRLARELSGLRGLDLLKLVTEAPARLFALDDRGTLEVGKRADLLVVAPDPSSSAESFCPSLLSPDRILLVVRGGRPLIGAARFQKLFDALGVRTREVRFGSLERLVDARYASWFDHVFRDDGARDALRRILPSLERGIAAT